MKNKYGTSNSLESDHNKQEDDSKNGKEKPNTASWFTINKPSVYVAALCCLAFMQALTVSGYHSGISTSLEKRYRLSSKNIGMISSIYNVASLIATLCVSYLGSNINRVRTLGIGAM